MARPIKETPILKGKEANSFLKKLVAEPKTISKEEIQTRTANFNRLESMRKFK